MLNMLLGWNTLIVPSGKSKDCSHTTKTFSMMYAYQRAWLLYSVKDIRKVALYGKLEIDKMADQVAEQAVEECFNSRR